jgi:hypothetical protein
MILRNKLLPKRIVKLKRLYKIEQINMNEMAISLLKNQGVEINERSFK